MAQLLATPPMMSGSACLSVRYTLCPQPAHRRIARPPKHFPPSRSRASLSGATPARSATATPPWGRHRRRIYSYRSASATVFWLTARAGPTADSRGVDNIHKNERKSQPRGLPPWIRSIRRMNTRRLRSIRAPSTCWARRESRSPVGSSARRQGRVVDELPGPSSANRAGGLTGRTLVCSMIVRLW
jgi:hypothetical protein